MDHERFMKFAIEEAALSLEDDELPIGAVLVCEGEIISKSHKTRFDNPRLDHAEIKTLRQCLNRSSKKWAREMTIYTTLEPCIMCFGTLLNCRIGGIVFAVQDTYGGISYIPKDMVPPRHRDELPEITGGILREEARKLFKQFFLATNQKFWQDKKNPLVKVCLAE